MERAAPALRADTGFPSTAFGGLIDAGVAVGWLDHAAAFSKRSFLGKALAES